MDIGSSQHSGAIGSCFIGGSSHSYPYMPEIGDSSVKKDPKKPRVSSRNSRAESDSRDGSGLKVDRPPGKRPTESNFPSLRKYTTACNPPNGGESPSQRARRHQWINPFCHEPEDDLSTCCLGCWLPCCLYGKTQHKLLQISEGLDPLDEATYRPCDGACWGFACVELWFGAGCVFATLDRTRIRAMYKIQGTVASDILTTMFCTRCVLMQHDREIRAREQLETMNDEKSKRCDTVYDQPSRYPDLDCTASPSSNPSSARMISHRSGLVREKLTEANVEAKAEKFTTEKVKEYLKSSPGGIKLRKYPKIYPRGEDLSKAKDSASSKSLESSSAGEKSVRNPSPLGSALNPITQPTKVDPDEISGIISSRQPWRGHGMTIKPASKPKRDPDQEMDNLTPETSRHPVADCPQEDTRGNNSRDQATGRRVVFKGSEDHSARVDNDSRFQKEAALVDPSQRRSSLAVSSPGVSDPTMNSTADESVLVYYSDGEIPQRHRVRDCARLRASTISRPETHRENRALSDFVSGDVISSTEQSEAETSKTMNANVGETGEHQDMPNTKSDGPAHNRITVELSPPDEKRPWAVSQHSLNDCIVEHVETVADPRSVQPILQHYLADCVQAECKVENTNVINVSQHSITDCATIKDIDSTRGSGCDTVTASGDPHGRALGEERSGTCIIEINLGEPKAVVATATNAGVTDTSPQADSSFRTKSPQVVITSTIPTVSDGAEPRPGGHHSTTAYSQTERQPSETPSEAALALRRVLREPIPHEPSFSNLLDGTTDTPDRMPIRTNRSRVVREIGKREPPH